MILRLRFHGRGGQGAKTASRVLGSAAFIEGLNVQDSPVYGAERRGAPVASFTRISDFPIMERGYIFDPDIVIVMDETLVNDEFANVFRGLREGSVVFVNSIQSPDKIDTGGHAARVITSDLTSLALTRLGKVTLSTAAAAAAARLTFKISDLSLQQGIEAELHEIGASDEVIQKNVDLAKQVFNSLAPQEIVTSETPTTKTLVPFELLSENPQSQDIVSVGNSFAKRTGDWRIFRPTIDYDKCTACSICFAYCPESALKLRDDGKPEIDYDNCKGCLICYRECPPKAITIGREVRVMQQ
ncbi:MAG: 2-oxoacid:acceptor oxidoreductase family protein [Nitrososphaerota archaeon]|nr:2-oxoacid:acceptor oxidoreductase family protein [Nitrososphaerota archaeon]